MRGIHLFVAPSDSAVYCRDMKRCFRFLLLAVLLSTPSSPAAEVTNAASRHTLWQAEGKSNVVYLLGSIHLLKSSDYPLPRAIRNAYTNSGIAVFETDLQEMNKPETQLRVMKKAALPEGETLKTQLSPEVYTAFQKELQRVGVPGIMFEKLKPSMAALTLFVLDLQSLGVDPSYGVDQYFSRRAIRDGKQLMHLETLDFQIDLLTDFSKAEGEEFVKSFLEQIDQTRRMYDQMVGAWKTGNAEELEKLLNEALKDWPVIAKKFLYDRNERWLPKVEELLQGGTNAIVIVGAGHLVGTNGVVNLLEKKGVKLKQL